MAPAFRPQQVRLGAVVAIAVAAGLGAWLGTRGGGHAGKIVAVGPTGKQVVPITARGLETLAGVLGRPIYWAGKIPGETFELTRLGNGSVYVRYLPHGTNVGSAHAALTVGTYPVSGAFADVLHSSAQAGAVRLPERNGGLAFYNRARPTNIYLAFPRSDFQVEVFDPDAAHGLSLVETGKIVPVPARSLASKPKLVSTDKLKSVAASLRHPLYWAGKRSGTVYELSTPGDRVYVRYLPTGAKAGANIAALTVGSYPVAGAFDVTKGIAARSDSVQVPVTGGGIAFYAKSAPSSVYVAFPGSNVQIEVYDPSPAEARQLVTSGKIVPIR